MKKIVGILICMLMIFSSFITISSAKIENPNTILNTTNVNENTNNAPEITSIEYCGTIKYDKDIGLYLCQWKVYFYDPDGDYVTLFFKVNDSGNWDYRPRYADQDFFLVSYWIELGTYIAYFYVEDVIGLKSDTISYSYVVTKTKSINQNIDDEKVLTSINDPLTIRVEAEQIGYRIWLLKAYVKNTLQEKINVKWTLPCNLAVLYIYPGEEDLEILVYNPYHKNIFNFLPSTIIKFEPGEEKLIQKVVFFGISNWILPGLSRGYQKYIPSFPWLPDGDYIFEASLNPYFVNNEGPQYHEYIVDSVFFHFGA